MARPSIGGVISSTQSRWHDADYIAADAAADDGVGWGRCCNIFVNYLPADVGTLALRDRFIQYGTIVSCRVMIHLDNSTGNAGQSKGYGFVMFSAPEAAALTIHCEHGAVWEAKRLSVSAAQRVPLPRSTLIPYGAAEKAAASNTVALPPTPSYTRQAPSASPDPLTRAFSRLYRCSATPMQCSATQRL